MTDSPSAPRHDNIAPAAAVGEIETAAENKDPNRYMADWIVEEPVSESAPLARQKAAELCRSGHSDGQDCDLYHGLWQYLRIFGVAAAPARNAGIFMDTLESVARDGGYSRMLISGAADYSMLAHVLKAYRNVEAAVHVTVLDRCETPLYLCRWYAKRMSVTIDTRAGDIMVFAPDTPFDALCCHSFLSRIPPSQRNGLISAWRGALRQGGKVITSTRLNPSWTADAPGFSPDQVTAFRNRVYREAVKHRDALGIDPDEIAEFAKQYAKGWRTYSIRTPQEITDLFEDGGFELERLDLMETAGRVVQTGLGGGRESGGKNRGRF